MALRLAINGFGRIGRNVMRAVIEQNRTDVEVVAINISGSLETNAHLLRYDSVHGRLNSPVSIDGNTMDVGFGPIRITSSRNIEDLDWASVGADIVLECTGAFNNYDAAIKHTAVGAKKVLISAPAKAADMTVVYGVNETALTKDHIVVSNASCTTNCLAPVASVLHQNIGIEQGFMTTIHSYTGDQRILDNNHKDPYRGRAAALVWCQRPQGQQRPLAWFYRNLMVALMGLRCVCQRQMYQLLILSLWPHAIPVWMKLTPPLPLLP